MLPRKPFPFSASVYPADNSERIDSSGSCESMYTDSRRYTHCDVLYSQKQTHYKYTTGTIPHFETSNSPHWSSIEKPAKKEVMHVSHVVHKCPRYCIDQFVVRNRMSPTLRAPGSAPKNERSFGNRSSSSSLTDTNSKAGHWQTTRSRRNVSDTAPVKTTAQQQMESHTIRLGAETKNARDG